MCPKKKVRIIVQRTVLFTEFLEDIQFLFCESRHTHCEALLLSKINLLTSSQLLYII